MQRLTQQDIDKRNNPTGKGDRSRVTNRKAYDDAIYWKELNKRKLIKAVRELKGITEAMLNKGKANENR